MSWQRHPDTEALAKYQAGLVGGFRGRRLAAHIAGCARCASVGERLAAVSPVLASIPALSMPDTVERQITAALAAEAATRQAATRQAATRQAATRQAATRQAAAETAGGETAGASPVPMPTSVPMPTPAAKPTPAPKPAGLRGGRSTRRFRPAMAAIPAVVCLLLAGLGYLLSQTGSSGTSSSAAGSAAREAAPASGHGSAQAAAGPEPAGGAIAPTIGPAPLYGKAAFTVIESGTNYHKATLATQVRSELTARGTSLAPVPSGTQPAASPSGNLSAPSGTSSKSSGTAAAGSTAGSAPSESLVDCVLHLTGNVRPSLVDRATYQGKPAYVIATADKAWVVGPDCTASDPAQITSVPLPTG